MTRIPVLRSRFGACALLLVAALPLVAGACGSGSGSSSGDAGHSTSGSAATTKISPTSTTATAAVKAGIIPSYDSALVSVAKAAGCSVNAPADEGFNHIGEGAHLSLTHPAYSSDPPTSGSHFGITARYGVYTDPVQPEFLIHNMEHGGVIVWRGSDSPLTLASETAINKRQTKTVDVPYSNTSDAFDVTAWGVLLRCPTTSSVGKDETAATALIEQFQDANVSKGRVGESTIPNVQTGTRSSLGAYTDQGYPFAKLPALPTPVYDTTTQTILK